VGKQKNEPAVERPPRPEYASDGYTVGTNHERGIFVSVPQHAYPTGITPAEARQLARHINEAADAVESRWKGCS
jgi:hypothetical protein